MAGLGTTSYSETVTVTTSSSSLSFLPKIVDSTSNQDMSSPLVYSSAAGLHKIANTTSGNVQNAAQFSTSSQPSSITMSGIFNATSTQKQLHSQIPRW